jgi:hypothetical protein
MKYLEITVLSLFIVFLIIFYLSSSVYNKCISENIQEPFNARWSKERQLNFAKLQVARAQRYQAKMRARKQAALQQKRLLSKMARARSIQRASNKKVSDNWDNTRKSQFSKYNSYLSNIKGNANEQSSHSYWRVNDHKKANKIPRNSTFSNSTPVQLNKLTNKIGDLYKESKSQDGQLEQLGKRITRVNNLLAS